MVCDVRTALGDVHENDLSPRQFEEATCKLGPSAAAIAKRGKRIFERFERIDAFGPIPKLPAVRRGLVDVVRVADGV